MDENPISHTTLKKFCPTRWTVRGASVTSILNNYCALIELWEQSLETTLDPDVNGRIIGVKSQMMKFPFLFGLLLCDRILNITDNLSKTLQSQSMSAVEAQHIAELTVKTLQGMRTDDMYKTFLDSYKRNEETTGLQYKNG